MSRAIERLASLVGAPLLALRFMSRGERELAEVRELARSAKKATAEIAGSVKHADERLQKHGERLTTVHHEINDLRRDLSDLLRQTNLQLGAMLRVLQQLRGSEDGHGRDSDNGGRKRLSGRSVPLTVNAEKPQWSPVIGGEIHPDPGGKEWLL